MSNTLKKAMKNAENRIVSENPVNLDSEAMGRLKGGKPAIFPDGLFYTLSAECREAPVSCRDHGPSPKEILDYLLP